MSERDIDDEIYAPEDRELLSLRSRVKELEAENAKLKMAEFGPSPLEYVLKLENEREALKVKADEWKSYSSQQDRDIAALKEKFAMAVEGLREIYEGCPEGTYAGYIAKRLLEQLGKAGSSEGLLGEGGK